MKNFIVLFVLLIKFNSIFGQNCIDSLSDNNVLILKNPNSIIKFASIKNNKSDFFLLKCKDNKISSEYLNSFKEKSLCIWNDKKLKRNKRSIIANSVIGGILLIPVFATIKNLRNDREPIGPLITIFSLAPISSTFGITAIGLGIKRAVILKKSKKNILKCNF